MENQKKFDDNPVKVGDEERCRRADGKGWRCKMVRSSVHNPSSYCDKHYEQKISRRRKLGGSATHHSSDEIGLKRQKVGKSQLRKCSSQVRLLGEDESQKCEVKLEKILGICKSKCVELLVDLEKKTMECVWIQGQLDELESLKMTAEEELKRKLERKRNLVWGRKEGRTCGRVTYLEGELKKMEEDMVHEKRRGEGEVAFWRGKVFDLEARVSRMENRSLESRISEPRGLVNDAPHNWEKEGDHEFSKRDDAAFSGGKDCSPVSGLKIKDKVLNEDEVDMIKHRPVEDEVAECPAMSISSESSNLSCRGKNAEGDDANGREKRKSVYESSSKNHLGLSEKLHDKVGNTAAALNLVCLTSDDESAGEASKESSDCSSDSESLGGVMDRMAMNYRNKVKEMKWEFEADMLSSFEEDPELCMKAVCALSRQKTFEEKSANWFFHHLDALRIKTLAEFLMEEDRNGDLKKSVKELEAFTPKALDDCKRLASSYSKQLFSIYKDKQDPFFLPTSTASH